MRGTRFAFGAILVAALPFAASAFQWGARAGVDYRRNDTWVQDSPRTTSPFLDLDLALDMTGYVSSPELVDWLASLEYRRLGASYNGETETVSQGISYRLQSTLFSSRTSPVTLTANADRSQSDVSGGNAPSGTVRSDSYGARARFRLGERPRLDLGYTRFADEQSNPILGRTHTDRDLFSAALVHGTPAYSYWADYRGVLSSGTHAADNADEHRANVSTTANLGRRASVHMYDAFYRRTPTVRSSFNPRQDVNNFGLRLQELPQNGGRDYQRASYAYVAGLSETPGVDPATRTTHTLAYELERSIPIPEWSLRGTATLAYDDQRTGTYAYRSAGQSLRTLGIWRRARDRDSTELMAGPSLGLLEEYDGRAQVGWGGYGSALLQRGLGSVTLRGNYIIDYAKGVEGPGWALDQRLTLTAEGPLSTGMLRGQLLASARRAESTMILSSAASRSLTGVAEYATRRNRVEARVGSEDGLSGAARDPGNGDALFIAPAYDSHARFASLLASTSPIRQIVFTASGRVTSTDFPDRPRLSEQEARAGITYGYGGFFFALEDHYVISKGDAATRRVNEVWVRAYRAIGGGTSP